MIRRNWPQATLWLCITLQAAITLSLSLTLRYTFKTSGHDGYIFAQLLHNAIAGDGLVTTIAPPFTLQHWLGFHFSPILYALAPIFRLFPHVETLLVLHSVFLALAAWPIYRIACHLLGSPKLALIAAISYLINPFVFNAGIWDFHEIAVAPLLIAYGIWAVITRRRLLLLCVCLLLLTVKEHYGLSVAGFGLLWIWHCRKRWRFGIGLTVLGLLAFCVILKIIMPHFSPLDMPVMMVGDSLLDRYSWLFDMFNHQDTLHRVLFQSLLYGLLLFFYFLFLPIASIIWLLPASADLVANMLTSVDMPRYPFSYHSAAIIPTLIVASIMYVRRQKNHQQKWIMGALAVLAWPMAYAGLQTPLHPGNMWETDRMTLAYSPQDQQALTHINAILASDTAITAQDNILPHIKLGLNRHSFPNAMSSSEYMILKIDFMLTRSTTIMGAPYSVRAPVYFEYVEKLLAQKQWGIAYYQGDWFLLKKGTADISGGRDAARKALVNAQKQYKQTLQAVKAAQ
ncbi:MAG: DUF2079 domain-containing protein [Rickettsiales bacterium]|nr:DUF2079 domain-containing protein [Rickettsiales bacterium]